MPKAKYDEIYAGLKRAVEVDAYPYGSLLPSENTLIGQYACSRNTIRRALAGLAEDGYIQPIHGKGVRVIYQPIERTSFTVGGIESFQESARRNRLNVVTEVIRFEVVTVDRQTAEYSGFPESTEIYDIQRVRYLDGKPLILDHNLFLKALVPGLTEEIAGRSIYAYIEQELGMQIVTSKRTITVERASAQDERLLDLGNYNCLAVVSSQTFNSDGVMFEYTQSRHRPDQFSFHDTAIRKNLRGK